MDWTAYAQKARTFDPFDTHPLLGIDFLTQCGPVSLTIPAATIVGNFHRPGTVAHQAAERFGGEIRFRGSLPALYYPCSATGNAALIYIEAAAAPRFRNPPNFHPGRCA
jgi:hypothetical protein